MLRLVASVMKITASVSRSRRAMSPARTGATANAAAINRISHKNGRRSIAANGTTVRQFEPIRKPSCCASGGNAKLSPPETEKPSGERDQHRHEQNELNHRDPTHW